MNKLEQSLAVFLSSGGANKLIAQLLRVSCQTGKVSYEQVETIGGNDTEDILLTLLKWRLLIPVRTIKCGEWDDRLLVLCPGEKYEMPNIARLLVHNAERTGIWDSVQAITDFFRVAGEPQWRLIPALVRRLKEGCPACGINASQIRVACIEMGFGERVDKLIAILKGAGVISPRLGSLSTVAVNQTPLYEINPCVFAENKYQMAGLDV